MTLNLKIRFFHSLCTRVILVVLHIQAPATLTHNHKHALFITKKRRKKKKSNIHHAPMMVELYESIGGNNSAFHLFVDGGSTSCCYMMYDLWHW